MKVLTPPLIGKRLITSTVLFLLMLIFALLFNEITEVWPYVIMAGAWWLFELLSKIKAPIGLIALTVIFMMLLFFGLQFWYYFVIPAHNNYQPVTNPRLFTIYQIGAKIQIFYSPDYPKQGDTMTGYISVCSNDYSKCVDLEKYNLTASFLDESGTEHILINNEEFSNKTNFELNYAGKPIDVIMNYEGKSYSFILPKASLLETIWTEFNRHPTYGFISFISGILGIITVFKISKIKELFNKIKTAYSEEIRYNPRLLTEKPKQKRKETRKTTR